MKTVLKLAFAGCMIAAISCNLGSKPKKISEPYMDTVIDSGEKQTVKSTIEEQREQDSLMKSGNTRLNFPGYSAVIHDFKTYDSFDDYGKLVYNMYPNDAKFLSHKDRLVTLTMLQDTFHTSISVYSNFYDNKIEIIPKNKDDKFEVDFSYQTTFSVTDGKKTKDKIDLPKMTDYYPMRDSADYFFKIPLSSYDDDFIRNDVRKKFAIKDTSIVYEAEVGYEAIFMYKNRPYEVWRDALYLRIKRFNNDKLIDTKFIRVDLPYVD